MKKLTKEQFIEKSNLVHGFGVYSYDKVEYVNSITKCIITCPIHGDFMQIPRNHMQGSGCPKCEDLRRKNWNKEKSIDIDEYIERCKEDCEKNNLKYIGPSENGNKKWYVDVQCKKCGNTYSVYSYDISRYSCKRCGYNRLSEFQKTSGLWKQNLKTNGEYTHLLTSRKNYDNLKVGFSSHESEVFDFISIFVDKDKILIRDRSVLYPYELDIYIPDLNLAIEFNGEYWHDKSRWESYLMSEECSYDECKEHFKTLECSKKGIKLIHIWEKEWLKNKEIIHERIKKEIEDAKRN